MKFLLCCALSVPLFFLMLLHIVFGMASVLMQCVAVFFSILQKSMMWFSDASAQECGKVVTWADKMMGNRV